ncbi:MAG: FG-GAP-like repeat-containing protein [Isosphaeraceae bacterium]
MPGSRASRRWKGPGAVLIVIVVAGVVWVVARSESTPEATWRAARQAMDARNWEVAERLLRDWVARRPEDGQGWLSLGSVLGTLGQDEEAARALGKVARDDPRFGGARLLLGDLALKRGDAREAEVAYRASADREPELVAPRGKLLGLLFVQGRKEEAQGLLRELYRLTGDPRHLIAWTGLALEDSQPGLLRDLGGEIVRLEGELSRFLNRTPDDPILRRARGLLRRDQGRPADALADLEFAADRLEEDPAGRLALGECRLATGNLDGLPEALGPAPNSPTALGRWWLLKGQVEAARGRTDAAIACAREAVAADPQSGAAHYQLGRALAGLGKRDEAQPILERAEAIRVRTEALKRSVHGRTAAVTDADECARVARLCLDAGLRAEARGWLEQAVRIDPTRREAQIALAALGDVRPPAPSIPRPRRSSSGKTSAPRPTVTAGPAEGPRFEDVAARSGLTFTYDSGSTEDLFIGDTMGGGVGLIDADGDGRLDVYFVNGCALPVDPKSPPAPNRLFRNQGDGTFTDVTDAAGVGGVGYGMGCAVADYDADGDADLFVTGLGSTVLYRNDGDGTFTDVTDAAGVRSDRWTTAAGFADLDGDGDLDLVVVTYVDANPNDVRDCRDADGQRIHCPPGKFPAWADHLFRNDGDGTFTDVAREAGLDAPDGRGLGLAIADLDDDGKLDLYVANDASPDFLYRNLGGLRFEEVGASSGASSNGDGLSTASMGVVAEDLDDDGRLDLFHTNFRNEANTLLRNLGAGQFVDATAAAGLDAPSRPFTGFGAAAFDADADGRIDLFVTNGHVDDQPRIGQPMAQPPQFYRGTPGGRFQVVEASPPGGYFARRFVGRGAAAGDLDDDGKVDLVVVHRDGPAALLRNVTPGVGHWLSVRLIGGRSGTSAVGARLSCQADGRTIVRHVTAGTGYLGAHDPRPHLGLGRASVVDVLEVTWPSGLRQRWTNLPADRTITIREGEE